jgi:hypothetical protein
MTCSENKCELGENFPPVTQSHDMLIAHHEYVIQLPWVDNPRKEVVLSPGLKEKCVLGRPVKIFM